MIILILEKLIIKNMVKVLKFISNKVVDKVSIKKTSFELTNEGFLIGFKAVFILIGC
jgi:hypothetical protein